MTDPYLCLRATSIGIGIYNVIYCLIQYAILGWQVKTVKTIQWEYENRQLPATGSIDGFQARFPGLYAIYTETPERRRINLLFTIVLICLGLSMIHIMTTFSMLYGTIRRSPTWIVPWFFTCGPIVVMCTAYAVLWWSGDVFNEQLTMSVAEFVLSLAINGIAFIVVLLYYLRITGRLKSERPARAIRGAAFANKSFDYGDSADGSMRRGRNPRINTTQYPTQYPSRYQQRPQQRNFSLNKQQQQQMYQNRPSTAQNFNTTGSLLRKPRSHLPCAEPIGDLPSWHEPMPDKPPQAIGRKMRRRERKQVRNPTAPSRIGHNYRVTHPWDASASLRRQASLENRSQSAPLANFDASYAPPVPVQYTHAATPIVPWPVSATTHPSQQYIQQTVRSQPALWQSGRRKLPPLEKSLMAPEAACHKSPQRVSFKSWPKIYERTSESSLSDSSNAKRIQPILREIHTVV